MNPPESRLETLLLLGPTGSGKTPLGDLLEERGLWGRRALHFDFGAILRAADRSPPAFLTSAEGAAVRRSLLTGALLDDADFAIVSKLLGSFVEAKRAGARDLVVLDGMPRHSGQAERLEPLADVRIVVHLRCTAETAAARIRADAGGDRSGRRDDSDDEVRAKLDRFLERTEPLIDHYRSRSVPVAAFDVSPRSNAREMVAWLEGLGGDFWFGD